MKTKSQLTLIYTLTCLALLPLVLLSAYYIYQSRESSIQEKTKKIHEIAKSKQVTLENHLNNYIKSINSFARSEIIIDALKNNNFGNGSYNAIKEFQEEMWGASHHIFIADPQGHIVLSPHHKKNLKSTHLNHSIAKSKYFKPALEKIQITDFYGFEESTHYHMLIMVPIKDQGKTLGVMISEITIQYFINLLKKDFELGKTGDIYLTTLENEKVVHLKKEKIKKVTASLLSVAQTEGQAYGQNKSFNQKVLGSYLKSEKYPWFLVVEISLNEVLAPINKVTKYVAFAYIFFLAVFLFTFKNIIKILKKPVQEVSKTLENISSGAIENSKLMRKNSSGLIKNSIQLSEALVENQGQLERVVKQIKDDTDVIRESLNKSEYTKSTASDGQEIVNDMTKNITLTCEENDKVENEVSKFLSEISKIVESVKLIQDKTQLINDIVFQTKLLSFNASVEAARAGEHGKGFAVVAEEVGNLAAMSGKASIEIHEMIDESVKEIEKIVKNSKKSLTTAINSSTEKIGSTKESIDDCKNLFVKILDNINIVNEEIGKVSRSAHEKVIAIEEVNNRFVSLKNVSEQSSAVASTVGNLTDKLKDDSDQLEQVSRDLTEKFAA